MAETGVCCTNCYEALELGDSVVVVESGVVWKSSLSEEAFIVESGGPYIHVLCQGCKGKLVIQEVQDGGA